MHFPHHLGDQGAILLNVYSPTSGSPSKFTFSGSDNINTSLKHKGYVTV